MPCTKISVAARQMMQLSDGRKTIPRCTADSTHYAIAAYRGSRDRRDNKFADAVLTSVAKSDAPDFDMPDDAGRRSDASSKQLDGTSLISPDADQAARVHHKQCASNGGAIG
jgi:hypothetical protein